jgi:hypothetical protein
MNTCNKPSSKVFTCSGAIDINKPVNVVFSYLADMANDQHWREEVKKTTVAGIPGIGCSVAQETELSKGKPLYLAQYWCVSFRPGEEAIYETTTDSADWQRSTRKCSAINASATRVHYTVAFERNIIKKGIPFVPPSFLVSLFLKATMKKYLRNLKKQLENTQPFVPALLEVAEHSANGGNQGLPTDTEFFKPGKRHWH